MKTACKIAFWERKGTVLVAVVVVVALLSLGGYTLTHWMTVETDIAFLETDRVQARLAAQSAIEYLRVLSSEELMPTAGEEQTTEQNFRGIQLRESGSDPNAMPSLEQSEDHTLLFSIFSLPTAGGTSDTMTPANPSDAATDVTFGATAEGGRINLTFWMAEDPEALRAALLELPLGTPELVDAVLDWLDEDDVTREQGAEAADYAAELHPRVPKNGPIAQIDELLQVRGMTAEILFGEDLNRNGRLDQEENDGVELPPIDNSDGELDRGWSQFLTVYSLDTLRSSDGRPRIFLNEPDLSRLYREIETEFDTTAARFVVAHRLFGGGITRDTDTTATSGPSDTFDEEKPLPPLTHRLTSALELVGGIATGNWNQQPVSLTSPWQWESDDILDVVEKLLDRCTVDDANSRRGRLDLRFASEQSLMLLSVLTPAQQAAIRDSQQTLGGPATSSESSGSATTLAWLAREGIVEPRELLPLSRVATLSSPVVRCQVIGHFGDRKITCRAEAVIDSESVPGRLLHFRRLDRFGTAGMDWLKTTPPRPMPTPTLSANKGTSP